MPTKKELQDLDKKIATKFTESSALKHVLDSTEKLDTLFGIDREERQKEIINEVQTLSAPEYNMERDHFLSNIKKELTGSYDFKGSNDVKEISLLLIKNKNIESLKNFLLLDERIQSKLESRDIKEIYVALIKDPKTEKYAHDLNKGKVINADDQVAILKSSLRYTQSDRQRQFEKVVENMPLSIETIETISKELIDSNSKKKLNYLVSQLDSKRLEEYYSREELDEVKNRIHKYRNDKPLFEKVGIVAGKEFDNLKKLVGIHDKENAPPNVAHSTGKKNDRTR